MVAVKSFYGSKLIAAGLGLRTVCIMGMAVQVTGSIRALPQAVHTV